MDSRTTLRLFLVGTLLLVAGRVSAQTEPFVRRLSVDIPLPQPLAEPHRIQAAASIGTTALVVWGTNRAVADTGVAGLLVMQFIRDGLPVGSPAALGSDDARPHGALRVLASSSTYYVVWNDRRADTPETWLAAVHADGAIADERKLSESALDPASIWLREDGGATSLIWTETEGTRRSIVQQVIDADGAPVGARRGPWTGRAITIRELDGETVIDRDTLAPLVIATNGLVEEMSAARAERFTGSYRLEEDGRFMTLRGDTVRIYASTSAATPDSTWIVQWPERIYPTTAVITRDSLGRPALVVLQGALNAYWPSAILAPLARFPLMPDGSTGELIEISRVLVGWPGSSHTTWRISFNGVVTRSSCQRTQVVEAHWWIVSRTEYQGRVTTDEFETISSYVIDEYGGHHYRGPIDCETPPLAVTRVPVDTVSAVALGDDTLRAPVAVMLADVEDKFPGVTIGGDGVPLVAWNRRIGTAVDFPLLYASAEPRFIDSYAIGNYLPELPDEGEVETIIEGLGNAPGMTWVSIKRILGPSSADTHRLFQELVAMPSDTGWVSVLLGESRDTTSPFVIGEATVDPVRRHLILPISRRFGVADSMETSIIAVDNAGRIAWRHDRVDTTWYYDVIRVVALGDDEFVVVRNFDATHWRKGGVIARYSFPEIPARAKYFPLGSDRILRTWENYDGSSWELRIEAYDMRGKLLAERDIDVRHPNVTVLLPDPANAGFVFVDTDSEQITITQYDGDLEPSGGVHRLDITGVKELYPAAAIHNDSIVIVWETVLGGRYDIMEARASLDRIASAPSAHVSGSLNVRAYPQPGRDMLRIELDGIELDGIEGEGMLRIVDMLGGTRLERAFEGASNVLDLPTESLPPGTYLLSIEYGGGAIARSITIAR